MEAMQSREMDDRALSRELATAVQADKTRVAVDEMKKRSILTARSYDEFRHLVACAQDGQKPLSSKEMEFLGKPGKREGYTYSRQSAAKGVAGSSKAKLLLAKAKALSNGNIENQQANRTGSAINDDVKTLADFQRIWKGFSSPESEDAVKFLLSVSPSEVFKVELNELGAIMRSLCFGLEMFESKPDLFKAFHFLEGVMAVERFSVENRFLSAGEKEVCKSVIELLKSKLGEEPGLKTRLIEAESKLFPQN